MKIFDAVKTGIGMTVGFLITLVVASKVTKTFNVNVETEKKEEKSE